jgi:hypothetical protein
VAQIAIMSWILRCSRYNYNEWAIVCHGNLERCRLVNSRGMRRYVDSEPNGLIPKDINSRCH